MPFQNAGTKSYGHSLVVFSFVVCAFSINAPGVVVAQPPQNQREYDSSQANAVVALRNVEGLLTPEMLSAYTAISKDFRTYLSSGPNGPDGRNPKNMKNLKIGLQYLVLVLSDLDVQDDPRLLENSRKKIEGVLAKAGSLISNADDKKRFRQNVYEEAYPFVQQLLQNNLIARSMGLEILLAMEVVQDRGGLKMQMFDQVDRALLSVVKDPKQPDAVKLRAANSIKRFLAKANASPVIENELAIALIAELKRKYVNHAYQNFIIAGLENVHAPRQLVAPRAPVVMCAAVEVMSDKTQHVRTRCRAARLAGMVASDSQVNFDPIAWKIADVALDTAVLYNQSKDKKDEQWLKCGYFIVTAFQAEDRRAKAELKGILNRAPKSEVALGAYKAALPLLRVVMTGKGQLGAAAGKLNGWITNNKPANLVYDAACPPIKTGVAANGSGTDG